MWARDSAMALTLTPTQQRACDALFDAASVYPVAVLEGEPGMGRTSILWELHRRLGGALLAVKDFAGEMAGRHPLSLEEAFADWVARALAEHPVVCVDSLDLI